METSKEFFKKKRQEAERLRQQESKDTTSFKDLRGVTGFQGDQGWQGRTAITGPQGWQGQTTITGPR